MYTSTIPATIQVRRSRPSGPAGVLAFAAVVICVLAVAVVFGTGSASAKPGGAQRAAGLTNSERAYVQGITSMTRLQQAAAFGGFGAILNVRYGLTPQDAQYVQGITSMTPEQQAAAFGR